jgi:hypothetical protein
MRDSKKTPLNLVPSYEGGLRRRVMEEGKIKFNCLQIYLKQVFTPVIFDLIFIRSRRVPSLREREPEKNFNRTLYTCRWWKASWLPS